MITTSRTQDGVSVPDPDESKCRLYSLKYLPPRPMFLMMKINIYSSKYVKPWPLYLMMKVNVYSVNYLKSRPMYLMMKINVHSVKYLPLNEQMHWTQPMHAGRERKSADVHSRMFKDYVCLFFFFFLFYRKAYSSLPFFVLSTVKRIQVWNYVHRLHRKLHVRINSTLSFAIHAIKYNESWLAESRVLYTHFLSRATKSRNWT